MASDHGGRLTVFDPTADGQEGTDALATRFNTLDGKAFELLRERGIKTGIVTQSRNPLIGARAQRRTP